MQSLLRLPDFSKASIPSINICKLTCLDSVAALSRAVLRCNIHMLEYKRQYTGSKCMNRFFFSFFLFLKSIKSAFLIVIKLMT